MINKLEKYVKKRNIVDVGMNSFYKSYVKRMKASGAKDRIVTRTKFSMVVKSFMEEMSDSIMTENTVFKLPKRLGYIGIIKKKYKIKTHTNPKGKLVFSGMSPNWKATKKLWEENPAAKEAKKVVYEMNSHSNGFIMKWFWSKTRSTTKNQTYYEFKASRANKRRLSEVIKNEEIEVDYFETF